MNKPSDIQHRLTWKCKLFGCKNEYLDNFTYHDTGVKHGAKERAYGSTACATYTICVYKGCSWCSNYKEERGEEIESWPKWFCDCEICENTIY